MRDLTAAMTYLESRKDVNRSRIGAVGWCMGGGYALQLAIAAPSLKAVAVNYGSLATDKAALARIHAAVLGNFGGRTAAFRPTRCMTSRPPCSLWTNPWMPIYPQAGHAFENPNYAAGYRPEDAADALARIDRFFAKELGH